MANSMTGEKLTNIHFMLVYYFFDYLSYSIDRNSGLTNRDSLV